MTDKQTYTAQEDVWIGPHLTPKGGTVEMTADEAQYYVPHILQLASDDDATPPPKTRGRKAQ